MEQRLCDTSGKGEAARVGNAKAKGPWDVGFCVAREGGGKET